MSTFLILSDIHACNVDPSSPKAPSYVSSYSSGAAATMDPISDLKRLIDEESLSPDFILCGGDITNKSDPSAFTYAWSRLQDLAGRCDSRFVATVGNHDVDSRYKENLFDPRGYAMSLTPTLPIDNRISFLEYWAENFTLLQYDDCNIVVLNTAAYHGAGKDAKHEMEHGRISDATLGSLKMTLQSAAYRKTNILLCHHHPIKAEKSDHELLGVTRGGDKLIDLLGESSKPWIIIHGHKHIPDLIYGHGGGANAPVVLGSASFSAQVNLDAQNKNPNQVHFLTVDSDGAEKLGLTYAGIVMSWTWLPGIGWRRARRAQGLPYQTGFGYKGNVKQLVRSLREHIEAVPKAYVSWAEAVDTVPAIAYLTPTDFESFRRAVTEEELVIMTDDEGALAQIGQRAP